MKTPSQIVFALGGSVTNALCGDTDPFICWVCGGRAVRGMLRVKWQGSNFVGQNRVRCPPSEHVCEGCVTVMAGKPPNTERMWTHLVEGATHVRVNKGSKPLMREFLRRHHSEPWFAAIADTGQKHVLPWCPVNPANQSGGSVLFEEALVTLPAEGRGWTVMGALEELLTAGATKEEIERGDYGPRAWQLCEARVRSFEEEWGHLRGGHWFSLALWLSQRDEAAVATRLDAEKTAKAAKKEKAKNDRDRQRATEKPDRRGGARTAKRIPRDARVLGPEALGSVAGSDAIGSANERDSRGVDDDHGEDAATRCDATGQRTMFS